jgi:predicted transcriptional regulator
MFKSETLENENRKRIYKVLESHPGIHLRGIQRVLNMPLTTVDYHLCYMARKNIIGYETDSRYKRYFANPIDPEDKKLLSILRQKKLREIILLIMFNGKAKFQYISTCLKIPNSTLSLYMKLLVEKEILVKERVGYEKIYTLKDEAKVAEVLITYKSGFLDKLFDKTFAMWMDAYIRKEKKTLPKLG